jgi:hypothetical protein
VAVKGMQYEGNNRENCENQKSVDEFSLVYEQLDNEAKKLSIEKEDLLAIEEELRFMLNDEIEARRKKNLSLRIEVEEQKRKCVELTRVLNASIRAQ